MFLKKFLISRTLCPTPRDLVSDMHVNVRHLGHLLLILHDHCWTSCPTFWGKTSDVGVKTSDMSGCPTVFQKH